MQCPPATPASLQIGQQLIALRALLPTADVAAVVAAHPPLLRMQLAEVEAALVLVRKAFPEASQVGGCVGKRRVEGGRVAD